MNPPWEHPIRSEGWEEDVCLIGCVLSSISANSAAMAELNPRQVRFIEEYTVDFNATQAAIRAGYSEKTARQIASKLLTDIDIQAGIAASQAKISRKTGITKERIAQNLLVSHSWMRVGCSTGARMA